MIFFTKIEKNILKFIEKYKRPEVAKPILSRKRCAEGVIVSDLRL